MDLKDKEIEKLKSVLMNSKTQVHEALTSLNNLQNFLIFSAEKIEILQKENDALREDKDFLIMKSKELDQINNSLSERSLHITHRYEILNVL
jgi:hypothetical protein